MEIFQEPNGEGLNDILWGLKLNQWTKWDDVLDFRLPEYR